MSERFDYFATAPRGLEAVVAQELDQMGIAGAQAVSGGVTFGGGLEVGYRTTLWLRSATRVLLRLGVFEVSSADTLYEQIAAIDWSNYMTVHHTLAVTANVRDSELTHSKYVALKTKDAIVDRFRDHVGRRPSVDTVTPDVRINVYIQANQAMVYLDMVGESLHKRGYRGKGGRAPLKESLAAGLLLLAGYTGDEPLVDAMCGSGTLAIEAALMAKRVAPGLLRTSSCFENWPNYQGTLWRQLKREAERQIVERAPWPIFASDIDAAALRIARDNARRARVANAIRFQQADIGELQGRIERGVIICNPPYGERLGEVEKLKGLYREIGNTFKQQFAGCRGFIFTGNPELSKHVGLKAKRRHVLYNGPIESRLLEYELY